MKIERIQVHFPSATTGPNGVPEHHQRISRSGDSPKRGKQHHQPDEEATSGENQDEQLERLQVEVVKLSDEEAKEKGQTASSAIPHLLDIKA